MHASGSADQRPTHKKSLELYSEAIRQGKSSGQRTRALCRLEERYGVESAAIPECSRRSCDRGTLRRLRDT